jgi:hypothetical protein
MIVKQQYIKNFTHRKKLPGKTYQVKLTELVPGARGYRVTPKPLKAKQIKCLQAA